MEMPRRPPTLEYEGSPHPQSRMGSRLGGCAFVVSLLALAYFLVLAFCNRHDLLTGRHYRIAGWPLLALWAAGVGMALGVLLCRRKWDWWALLGLLTSIPAPVFLSALDIVRAG
jgi:hypothetical protein